MRKKTLIGFAEYAWSKSKGISWGEVDPLLSATGRTQCAAAAAELVYLKIMLKEMQQSQQLHLPSQDSAAAGEAAAGRSPDRRQTAATAAAAATTDGGFCIQTFLVSPFTRTLQTASLSFHDVGTSLKCQEPTVQQPQQQRQQQQQQQQQHVTWLVDSLLKEKYGNMTDTGTEVAALRRRLRQLYVRPLRRRLRQLYVRGELAPTVFSFRLVPEGQKWWLPYVPDSLRQLRKQLQQQLLQLQQGNALLEESVQEEDEHQSLLRGTSKPESAPLGFVSGAPTSSSSASAAGVAAVGTEVSEEDKNLFVIGGAEGGPLAAAEKSVLQTLEQAEQSLHTPEAFRQRQQQHDDAVAAAAAEGHLWRESWKEVTDRQQLLLLILCAADASTFFFVSHSNFLAGLDQQPRLDNGQLRPLLLRCNVEPEISPL
ncbi:uncharacterized protein EMH_0043480 [Eimeria mitis]|uniref:Uncharacterized protein n=1 Tax=Eimeria mitis TaxID=44415 RepID=U6JXE6_9EIME|nr:uncharacterized protein EMH_0043480 [Eimeria mitis]CDJ28727.1 hypothetical protein EMH_0043480 [Eimeria mitis]